MNTLMMLGPFRFGLDRIAFEESTRTSGYNWAEIERIGSSPALHYVGTEADTLSLPGKMFPHWRGGLAQLPAMRIAAELGRPLPLITGYGSFLGLWVITKIEERASAFFPDGAPRRIDFVIELKQYDSGSGLILSAVSTALGAISRLFA